MMGCGWRGYDCFFAIGVAPAGATSLVVRVVRELFVTAHDPPIISGISESLSAFRLHDQRQWELVMQRQQPR